MSEKAFQDAHPDKLRHCHGCGRLNRDGLQLESYWDGDETAARFRPRPSHMAIPGYVHGGLPASLIDCHGTGATIFLDPKSYTKAKRSITLIPCSPAS